MNKKQKNLKSKDFLRMCDILLENPENKPQKGSQFGKETLRIKQN